MVTRSSSGSGANDSNLEATYHAHSLVHKATIRLDPTKLEMLDGFDITDTGFKYVPTNSNIRLVVSGQSDTQKTVLIYGSKSEEEAYTYIQKMLDEIRDVGHLAELNQDLTLVNIAVSGEFKTQLKLEELSKSLQSESVEVEYEPEQFPALIVKLSRPSATFLLFSNGKFSIQGLKDRDEIPKQINKIRSLINLF